MNTHQNDKHVAEGDVNITPARETWSTQLPESTQALLAEDARWFLHQSLSTPCLNVVSAAAGVYLEDVAGNRILDFHGNNVHQLGHGHPRVVSAIIKQLQQLPFSPRRYTNETAVQLAKRLAQLAPGDDSWKLLFAPGAAEAVSMALKLARRATGRYKTISLWGSFHGATMDTIAIGGESLFHKGLGPLLPGALHVPPYLPRQCVFACGESCSLSCVRYINTVFEQEGEIGAVIVETIRNTDVVAPPLEYYQELRAICDRHGALLILDETAIAFGRTGKMFAIEHYNIQPDMIVVGKGLGGGVFPFAALLARDDLNIAGDTSIGHFTHEKSPVGAAAALALLDTLADERLIERAAQLEEPFAVKLQKYTSHFSCVGPMRHIGLLFALDIVHPDQPKVPWNAGAEAILYEALARGLSFKVSSGSVLTLSPPLIIEPEQWESACRILAASIEAVLKHR
ncbi:aspartate aminotransferase family protein [Dictyobacter sp. S3.2.2.5]|uniref:Aspartate aminotransferase family protein n=1 Tax=Dictyobacter halimunensis TaxID=3026934 RepID=A0ABQ6FJ54_9CHLR|nr:aspartate aminotransferase family protein [Dictyobacter sp. S3.2.2.5]